MLAEIESFRVLARYAPEAASRLPAVLDQIDLIDLDQRIRMLAQTVNPVTVRSLDAIHLGTALRSRSSSTSFVTYDKRLLCTVRRMRLSRDIDQPGTSADSRVRRASFVPVASDEPSDNGPGSGSYRQASSDGRITWISAEPTRRDLA